MTRLEKLISIGSAPRRAEPPHTATLVQQFGSSPAAALLEILGRKNGFYAFESALYVRADRGGAPEYGLVEWNAPSLWRDEYEGISTDGVFFAEDIFGRQFCLRNEVIGTFEPETGEFTPMATSIESWADQILEDYNVWTGYPLAKEWQAAHGALPIGSRLASTIPFVAGGQYALSNVHCIEDVKGMACRASFAVQIRDLPDGTTIPFKVTD